MNPSSRRVAAVVALVAGTCLSANVSAKAAGVPQRGDLATHAGLPAQRANTHALTIADVVVDTSVAQMSLANAIRAERSQRNATRARRIMQLDGPMTHDRRQKLASAGIKLGQYLPTNAFYIDTTEANADAVARLDFIRWQSPIQTEWKRSPDMGTRVYQTAERQALLRDGRERALVILFEGASDEMLLDLIAATPGASAQKTADEGGQLVVPVEASFDDLAALAELDDVMFIQPAPEITFRNATNRWIVQTNQLNNTPMYDNGLRGEDQVIAVLDGRVNVNHCSFQDSEPIGPSHRKIVAYNTSLGSSSHGTHVAGTAVGDAGNDGDTRGVAYNAKMTFDDTPSFNDAAVYAVLQQHHDQGARIHTNSWGDDGTTSYNSMARGFDRFMYDNEDSLVLLAVTNGSTLRNPENAKNLLACGASQDAPNQNSFCSGGTGTTADGRRKPEIFAPGCNTISASNTSSCGTRTATGTSMATPAIAGAAALVRQYYTEGFYPTGEREASNAIVPSGALLKATLLNSTDDMTNIAGFPSNAEGWGRINLSNTITFDIAERGMIVEDIRNADGLATGEFYELPVLVTDTGSPLRITMTFVDAPAAASTGSGDAWINDLDLVVTAPSGAVYRGNVFSGGESATGGAKDEANNVEQVRISTPETGTYVVRIDAAAVNVGTQGFALVSTGRIDVGDLPLGFALQSTPADLVVPGTSSLVGIEVDPRDENLVGAPVVQYAADGSNFTAIPLTNAGGFAWTGTLPVANCGDAPTYYFEAEGDVSGVVRFPASNDRTFSVGEEFVTVQDEFDSQGDWAVGPDTATTGNWEVAVPQATNIQPGAAVSPATCWITDGTAGAAVGSFDIDNGSTILTSPAFDLSGSGSPIVSYQRWFNNGAGTAPGQDILLIEASNDNGASWVTVDQAGPTTDNGGGWILSEWNVTDFFASPSSTFLVRFTANDSGNASLVEAAIDDFSITETVCIDVPTCTADTTTDGTSNGIPDGVVTLSDFSYYLGLWGAADTAADVTTDGTANGTPDGSVTLSDFSFYLGLWGAGCP